MSELEKLMSTPILSKDNKTVVSVGTLVAMGIGATVLYYCIPERKRKNLF